MIEHQLKKVPVISDAERLISVPAITMLLTFSPISIKKDFDGNDKCVKRGSPCRVLLSRGIVTSFTDIY